MVPVSAIIIDHDLNRSSLLLEAIKSILENSLKPSEIIIVLDLKKDEFKIYKKLIEENLKIDPTYIKIYKNEFSKGPAGARNYAISLSQNNWLAFLDSDDLWHKEKLYYQWNFMQKRPFLKASHTKELWLKNNQIIQTPKRLEPGTGKFLIEAFRHCLISMSSILIRKDVFKELNGFDERLLAAEDYDFWLRYLIHYPIALIPDINKHPPTIKRSGGWHQTSMTKNIDVYRVYSLIKIYKNYFHLLSIYEQEELLKQLNYRFKIICQQRKKYNFSPYIEKIYQKILEEIKLIKLS
ncbi:MAG: glycosyl transferase [Leptospiraceae bacterium]|nr:MAG: glycosyl transferase [Leptospiraceae bacterium]GIX43558.1 MAG: glycosyl transferase [Leptospiraceae bacterium]